MHQDNNFLARKNSQREIKHLLKNIGWNMRQFSDKYLVDTKEYDVEDHEFQNHYEKFKKQLKRESTGVELLIPYLRFIKETSEYNKLKLSTNFNDFEPLTGLIKDHQIISSEEPNSELSNVLGVATAYALAIGVAWNFKVVSIGTNEYIGSNRFVVIWTGDVGHNGGSGSWGTAMCEVAESFSGVYFVENTIPFFETSLRDITEIVGYDNGKLSLIGYTHAEDDVNNKPTMKYQVTLIKEKPDSTQWKVIDRKFLERNYLFNV